VLIHACSRLRLDPVPYLLALACSANIGSAWTLIGNPQNMLIGQTLRLSFAGYSAEAALPVALGLAATWAIIAWQSRGRWDESAELAANVHPSPLGRGAGVREELARPVALVAGNDDEAPLDSWQTAKGLVIAALLLGAFLFSSLPREHVALTAAGVLLMSRKLHTTKTLGLVDWELLILFMGLFVVNHALQQTGLATALVKDFAAFGFDLRQPGPLFAGTFVLSNLVSNVPAVMLLLPFSDHAFAGPLLALVSTLAGNLLIVGSIANIIVVDAARRRDIRIDWRRHARVGVPVTLVTLAITAGYLWLRVQIP